MPDMNAFAPQGMLHEGWSAQADDYAINCGWGEDGKTLLVGDAAGGLYAFKSDSGDLIWDRKEVHRGGLLALEIHPDGDRFATSGQDGIVIIWNGKTGEQVQQFQPGKSWVEHLAWSNDGQQLAVASGRNVYTYNSDGKEEWRSDAHPSTVSAISWSKPDELASACYGRVTFFNITEHKEVQKLEWQGSLVSMVLSPDGDIVACGSQDNSVHFWRRTTGLDAEMTGYPGKPSQLAFDHSGRFLATGGSDQIIVWNFQGKGPEGSLPGQLVLHPEPISCLAFANQGLVLASGSRDGSVFVWFLDKNGDGSPLGAAFVGERVSEVCWKPNDSALAAIDAQGGINVWNFKIREEQKS
jgi:WD40 repeat protein